MKKFKELTEAKKFASFTFGRFNPPTIGHEKLLSALVRNSSGTDMFIYPSHSQNPKKDPLPHALKVAYMRKMFPRYAKNIMASKEKTVFEIVVSLYNKGYTSVTMVVGSDRVKEFDSLIKKYNKVNGRHGYYDFDEINVVSAGERDPDAEGVSGMSASKMRAAASENDVTNFLKGLPKTFRDGRTLFRDVRRYMGIKEEIEPDDYQVIRDLYVTNQIWNVGDLVEANDIIGTIVNKGTNYVAYADDEGKVHKAWLHELRKVKQDKDVEDDPGTQPAKYYSGVKKKTKDARAAHFRKGAKMDDDNPAAYKPAPGDAKGKTKPSKHTQKYKQMFGERAKQAVSQGKVQKLVTAHGLKFKGKVHKEIDMELKKINNSTEMVTFKIIHPKELFGNETNISFKALRRGPFMATDTSKINEKLGKDADAGDYIDDFRKSDAPQFKGKSDKKIRDMAIAAYLDTKDKKEKKEEKAYFRKDKKFSNLRVPVKRKSGKIIYRDPSVYKVKGKRTTQDMLAADVKEDCSCYDHVITESEYQGRKVKLNDPFRLPTGSTKKFGVYVKNEKDNIVKVTFGDPNMGINRDDPAARKSFRARHNCDDPGPKTKARYWSCFQWRAGAKVDN